MNYLLDTNAVIYLQKGLLAEPLPAGRYFLSVISEIELLSFPGISPDQELVLRDLLQDITVVGLGEQVKREAIRLRQQYRLRLPDAIIAATSLCLTAELVTNDAGLTGLPEVKVCSMVLKSPQVR